MIILANGAVPLEWKASRRTSKIAGLPKVGVSSDSSAPVRSLRARTNGNHHLSGCATGLQNE